MYSVDKVAKAFGNPKRLKLLSCLADSKKHVAYLQDQCELSQSAVSQHLKILHEAGLITKSRDKKRVVCELRSEVVGSIAKQIIDLPAQIGA